MYSFEPTEEQKMLVEAIHRYSEVDLRSNAHDSDEEGNYKQQVINKGWELGYLQASIPEDYGGFGERSLLTGVLAAEELAWGDLAGALGVLAPDLFVLPIYIGGTEDQKERYIPKVIAEEWKPYTSALIEPSFDFDPGNLKTTAVEADGFYELNGNKTYVPYAEQAEGMVVYANLNGLTQGFLLTKDTPGVNLRKRVKLLGINGFPLYEISLNQVRLPVDMRIGGQNGHEFAPVLDASRVALAAMAIGLSRAAFEYSRDYAKEREVFGVKVAQKQAIAFMLAEMATEIEATRLLVWEAAWMLDNLKEDAGKHAYLALTGAADMAMMVTDRAVQILGGYGYIREYPVELWMRNGRGIAILNGLALV
jgi:acyl-CoA dehydrogenase